MIFSIFQGLIPVIAEPKTCIFSDFADFWSLSLFYQQSGSTAQDRSAFRLVAPRYSSSAVNYHTKLGHREPYCPCANGHFKSARSPKISKQTVMAPKKKKTGAKQVGIATKIGPYLIYE